MNPAGPIYDPADVPRLLALSALVVLLAALPTVAHALPWWVEEDDDAERLAAVLDALWPDHPIEVVVGPPDFGREGVSYDDGALLLVRGDLVRRQASDGDMATQVALVRSWLRETVVVDRGWLPPGAAPKTRSGPFALLVVGGGARLPTAATTTTGEFVLGPASPTGWLLGGGGYAWRHLRLGARVGWSFGERAGVGSEAIGVGRVLLAGSASLIATLGALELENTVAIGARLAVMRTLNTDAKAERRVLPALTAGVWLWGPLGPLVDFGGGLSVGVDAASLALRVGEDAIPLLLSPVTVVGEIGVRIGCPCPVKDPLGTRFSPTP